MSEFVGSGDRPAWRVALLGLVLACACSSGNSSASPGGGGGGIGASAGGAGSGGEQGTAGAGGSGGLATGLGGGGASGTSAGGIAGSAGAGGLGGMAAGATCPDGDVVALDGAVPVSGAFLGSNLQGAVCLGAAVAYMFRAVSSNVAGQPVLMIQSAAAGDAAARIVFDRPADALYGQLSAFIVLSAAKAGVYTSATSCGSVGVSAILPVPPEVHCGGDPSVCPAGCAHFGPVSSLTCTPIQPERSGVAQTSSDCLGEPQTPAGSWTLTLTSDPDLPAVSADGSVPYVPVHGTLEATLVTSGSGADGSTVELSLSF